MATQNQASKHLDMSTRMFKNLIDQGVIKQYPRGEIDLDEVRVAYIRHQRGQLVGRSKANATMDEERKRLISGQADKVELEVDQMAGALIPAEEVRKSWMDHVMSVRAVLLSLPSKISPVVMSANTVREVEDFARTEVYRALDELEASTQSDQEGSEPGLPKTSTSDGKSVGAAV